MTDGHRRHLASTIRYLGRLLDEAQRMLRADGGTSRFGAIENDLSASSRDVVAAALDELGHELLRVSARFDLDLRGQPVSAMRAIRAQLSVMSIAVDEMRPRSLQGYGELDARSSVDLEAACDQLSEAVSRTQAALNRTAAQ